MTEFTRCPKCGSQLTADAPAGLCPKCLIKAGFESQPLPPFEPGPTLRSPASEGFQPPSVKELAGKFPQLEILELLGKGGMGAVYKARQPGLDRLVAVKILPPEVGHDAAFTERFTREARALARLSHPHIVAVYDFGVVGQAFQPDAFARSSQAGKPDLRDGLCFIVMEFVDGVNLRQMIQTGTLTAPEALAIVPQICEALQFAHDEGIVHRDIKPENILIDKRGRVKIADFGLAKLLGTDATGPALTATHQVMGTLRYMAPEQLQGSREVDHRADIYSLGVVFYELLTGELPMGRFAPPSRRVEVDVRLDEIVLRALEQEPEQRYQHASEVKTDIESISRESRMPNPAVQNPVSRDGRTPPTELQSLPSVEPRLSRIALAGAIWIPLFFIAAGASMVTQVSTGEPREPALWQLALGFTLLPLGMLAPFGTTILGAVAIAKINRSRGRLYGLGLATADVLFFPLLAINAAIFGVLLYFQYSGLEMKFAMSLPLATAGTVLFGGWVSSMIIRRVWGVISRVTEKPGERDGFGRRKDEERIAALTPPSSPLPRTQRPKLVPVIAVFNLVGAILLLLVCAMEEPAAFAMPMPKLWQVWEKVDALLGFGMAAGVFAASIGLFLWKPWARELTLSVCIFGLASVVFDAPYLARFALPGFYAEIQQTLIAEGVDPAIHPFMSLLMIVCFFGGMLAVSLTWMIGQLVYFSRPGVVAAFDAVDGKQSKFFKWLFTGKGLVVALLSVFGPLAILLGIMALFDEQGGTQTVDRSVAKSDSPFVSGMGVATSESSSGWTMGEAGPELTDIFGQVVLRLQPSQIEQVNAILQRIHADYIEIEARQIEQNTDDAGHIVVRINPSPRAVAELENRLWSELDMILDPQQQSIARLNLKLDPPEVQPPIALSELVRPGFFGWGNHGATLEIWRVGTWFHWKIQTRGFEDSSRAPQLPEAYRRFWIEPATADQHESR